MDATRIMGSMAAGDILVVGEDNPLSQDFRYALYHEPPGCAGHRLQSKIMGLSPRVYLSMWRTNLCVGGWDKGMAESRAAHLIGHAVPWSVVIMLGRKVCDAFEVVTRSKGLGEQMTVTKLTATDLAIAVAASGRASVGTVSGTTRPLTTTFLALSHPSGRNTLWNNPLLVGQARELLREIAPHVPWGEVSE